ncbi:hypothetical protein M2459_001904 [Parabacteroides sp. PF5-5]|nr:hypothetical protein [Parabacteroides sp. PF5-13]MDH6327352.1 hypothetical protein [Parabacteroides sp. PH5-41]MDH6335154.1 hypothetical protein [Parabacteroides sp. PF5-5]
MRLQNCIHAFGQSHACDFQKEPMRFSNHYNQLVHNNMKTSYSYRSSNKKSTISF